MIPKVQFSDIGPIAPTRAEITSGLWEIMRAAFGADLTIDARTPQGQLVTSLTAALEDQNGAMIELANNFDPRYAYGKFQEALAEIYFLDRKLQTHSVVILEFVGIVGTVIPAGFLLVDDAGIDWIVSQAGSVGSPVRARCSVAGPIQAAPNTIVTMKQSINGVDRVTNPASAAAGSDQEGRVAFEDRRYQSVAANSKGMNASVFGAVGNLPGVIDTYVVDNPTDSTITVGPTNYSMIRNSLLVSVVGGDNYEIAGRIVIKGGTGCSFVGNTTVTWQDSESTQAPYPEYVVKFVRPDLINISVRLTVVDAASVSFANIEKAKADIVSEFQSGEGRARIGGMMVGANLLCGLDTDALRPVRLELSRDGVVWSDVLSFGVDEYPVTSTFNVSVVSL